MELERTHDKLYLNENRKKKTKESFQFIVKQVQSLIAAKAEPEILDVGCATGDFLYYLSRCFPEARLFGLEFMEALYERAKTEVPQANFWHANIMDVGSLPEQKFDFVFTNGVHSIFNDYQTFLDNMLSLCRKTGHVFVFGIFNPEPLDVLTQVRAAGSKGAWESGWNLLSKQSFSDYLKQKDLSFEFVDFDIPIDLPRQPQDLLRSWTLRLEDGSRAIINGMQLLHPFSLLKIAK